MILVENSSNLDHVVESAEEALRLSGIETIFGFVFRMSLRRPETFVTNRFANTRFSDFLFCPFERSHGLVLNRFLVVELIKLSKT